MTYQTVQAWELAARQHGVISRPQLLALGFSPQAILQRRRKRRLHPVFRGVFAVGRPELTRYGRWMAAVLACRDGAVLSHRSAAGLWEIRPGGETPMEVSVPARRRGRPRSGLVVHRRAVLGEGETTVHRGIPVTTIVETLIDIAPTLRREELEAAINEADKRGLANPEQLRTALENVVRPGAAILRATLDRHTFSLTDSVLERRFLGIARAAGLPRPRTQARVNGFRVDFHWPDMRLVVETDGLTYHRTPAQQAKDHHRDQVHAAAGLTTLRFTQAQVAHEPAHVEATLAAVARRTL
jgi:very-short-patch-repair endonuclease